MHKLFAKDHSLRDWVTVAALQSLIGGSVMAVAQAIWFFAHSGDWRPLVLFPLTVAVTFATFIVAALISYPIYKLSIAHLTIPSSFH